MGHKFAEIAFTDKVKSFQESQGSRRFYAKWEAGEEIGSRLTEAERMFISGRDSFYIASIGETGWPYIQHRGGPAGFVKILDDRTLGFVDFRGNRQYVTAGNLTNDDRVALFFMDYAAQARLKLFGRASIADDPKILERLALPDYRGRVERGVLIRVEAFDWNCPQHITPRYTESELVQVVDTLKDRIRQFEARQRGPGHESTTA